MGVYFVKNGHISFDLTTDAADSAGSIKFCFAHLDTKEFCNSVEGLLTEIAAKFKKIIELKTQIMLLLANQKPSDVTLNYDDTFYAINVPADMASLSEQIIRKINKTDALDDDTVLFFEHVIARLSEYDNTLIKVSLLAMEYR